MRPSVTGEKCWQGHRLTITNADKTDPPMKSRQKSIHMKKPINVDILRKMLVEWVVECRHAFIEIESLKLRAILKYMDPWQSSSNMLMANKI